MIEAIIAYLQTKLSTVFPEFDIKCLCEKIKDEDSSFPAEYSGKGEFKPIDLDSAKGTIYFRIEGDVAIKEIDEEETISCAGMESQTYPLKAVLYCSKELMSDNGYSASKLGENLKKALTVKDDRTLRTTLQAESIYIRPGRVSFDIIDQEYEGEKPKIHFEDCFLGVSCDVEITGSPDCFEYWSCNDERVTFNSLCDGASVFKRDGDRLILIDSGGSKIITEILDLETVAEIDGDLEDIGKIDGVLALHPATVKDSAGTSLGTVVGDQDFTVDDSAISNSAGTLLQNVKAEQGYTVGDSTIKNSAGTTLGTTPATVAFTLADITVTNYDGTTQTSPGGINVTSKQLAIGYAYPEPTGQVTIYRTRDDAWVEQNYFAAFRTEKKTARPTTFFTITPDNVFGNSQRFTGTTGGYYDQNTAQYKTSAGVVTTRALAYPNDLMIDHFTGLMTYMLSLFTGAGVWNDCIDGAVAASFGGYTDWFVPSTKQAMSLINYNFNGGINWAPLSIDAVSINHFLSTTSKIDSSDALQTSGGVLGRGGKTSVRRYFIMRKHY